MCSDTAPKTYLSEQLSPLHDRVLEIFDTVEVKHHQCMMDNHYNSAAFFKSVYNNEKKLTCGIKRE